MDFKLISNEFLHLLLAEPLLPKVLAVLIVTMLANYIAKLLLRKAGKVALLSASPWDDALIQAGKGPLPVVTWVLGIAFASRLIFKETGAGFLESSATLRDLGVIICLTWFLIRLIRNISLSKISAQEKSGEVIDPTTIDALSKLSRLTVMIVAILMILQTLGISVSGLLAAGGIGGIAIGFAAKDLLANFFGGLTIYMDRPFSVGDWIRSPDKAIEGTVEYISWRHTRIRAFNKNPIYVPNALFTTIVVENPTRMTNRRIKETIGIRYEDISVMKDIITDVKSMLQNHPEIDTTKTLIVNFNTFGPSSLDFFIYTFTKTKEWILYHEIKQDVLLKIAEIIELHGAQIAYPTQTLHLETSNTTQ